MTEVGNVIIHEITRKHLKTNFVFSFIFLMYVVKPSTSLSTNHGNSIHHGGRMVWQQLTTNVLEELKFLALCLLVTVTVFLSVSLIK
jgi:hypothetical protein